MFIPKIILCCLFLLINSKKDSSTDSSVSEESKDVFSYAHFLSFTSDDQLVYLYEMMKKFRDRKVKFVILSYNNMNLSEIEIPEDYKYYEIFPSKNLKNETELEELGNILKKKKINVFVNHFTSGPETEISTYVKNLELGIKIIHFSTSSFLDKKENQRKKIYEAPCDLYLTERNYDMLLYASKSKMKPLHIPKMLVNDFSGLKRTSMKEKLIVMTGRTNYLRNFELAIDSLFIALQEVPEIKLYFVGFQGRERGYYDYLVSKIIRLNLTENVLFVADPPDTGRCFGYATIYLIGSQYEGSPEILAEAKARGLPVIATGPAVINVNGKGVKKIKDQDYNLIGAEIVKLFTDKEYLKKMSQEAFENPYFMSDDDYVNRWNEISSVLMKNSASDLEALQDKYNDHSPEAYSELSYLESKIEKPPEKKKVDPKFLFKMNKKVEI